MQNQVFNISKVSLFLFLFIPFLLVAQNGTKSFQKEFNWEKADETKTIFIDVKNGAEMLKMDFEGNISQGNLHLTAYDPEGNRIAGFSLETSGSENSNVHVETISGGGGNYEISTSTSNTNSNSNSNINSSSDSNITVTTSSTASEDGSSAVAVKSKSKNKSKNKNKDGKSYSVTSTTSDSKSAKGIMKKKISDPMPGKWKFVLEVKDVSGNLSAEIDQD